MMRGVWSKIRYCTNPINSPDRVMRDRKGEFTNPPNADVTRDRGDFRRDRGIFALQYSTSEIQQRQIFTAMFSDLNIPPDILQQILPSENLSIADFLSFEMPPLSSRSPGFQAAQIFVVPESPQTSDIDHIISAPVPVASRMKRYWTTAASASKTSLPSLTGNPCAAKDDASPNARLMVA